MGAYATHENGVSARATLHLELNRLGLLRRLLLPWRLASCRNEGRRRGCQCEIVFDMENR